MSDADLRQAERAWANGPGLDAALALLVAARRAGEPPPVDVLRWALDIVRWDRLGDELHEALATSLGPRLPPAARFDGLEACTLGPTSHRVAFFRVGDDRFALVPGGTVTLGFELPRTGPPTLGVSLQEALAASLTPVRTGWVAPLLVDAEARRPRGGSVHDWRHGIEAAGFALPGSNEWEHLCAAGARTLFRWGRDCPTGAGPAEVQGWDLHRRPNAFGLRFADDGVDAELVAEPDLLRGGDGGGDRPAPIWAWITLASAFVLRHEAGWLFDQLAAAQRLLVRRAWPILRRPSAK